MPLLTRLLRNVCGNARASILLVAFVALLATPSASHGQQADGGGDSAQDERTPEQTLADFVHFVKIGRFDVAEGLAKELVALDIPDAAFVDLVERTDERERFDEALAQALRVDQLEDEAANLRQRFERGKLQRARDPEQIAENIEDLTGPLLARVRARDRLLAAGEYAMPQLLDALLQTNDVALSAAVQDLMVQMGRQAVRPLAEALRELDPTNAELVARILGNIGYRQALPALVDRHQRAEVTAVREATARAIRQLGGRVDADPATLMITLAEAYYDEQESLTSFPGEDFQLVWEYDDSAGLLPIAVRTPVFHEMMSMRLTERSLQRDPRLSDAVSLWIASNFSREIDQPEGYDNPLYGDDRRDALFYAVSGGPAISQQVLRRALDDLDTRLARRAIEAVERTAGRDDITRVGPETGAPLIESLGYSNRRVRYDAALAIGRANPASSFPASERVVPTLAGMIREADARFAVVLAGNDREEYDRVRSAVEAQGFEVLPPADGNLSNIATALAEAPGIDLIVISEDLDDAEDLYEAARGRRKLAATPAVLLVDAAEIGDARSRFGQDETVEVRRASVSRSQLAATMESLIERVSGGVISDEEARRYASRALGVLRDLAISGNTVLNIADASLPLTAALRETSGQTRLQVADVLSRIGEPPVQVALMDAALDARSGERVDLLARVRGSAKRYGNMLEPRQVRRLVEIVSDTDDDETATAAASLMGALGLPNTDLVPLIVGGGGDMAASRERP